MWPNCRPRYRGKYSIQLQMYSVPLKWKLQYSSSRNGEFCVTVTVGLVTKDHWLTDLVG